jgi:hypothetical protein
VIDEEIEAGYREVERLRAEATDQLTRQELEERLRRQREVESAQTAVG